MMPEYDDLMNSPALAELIEAGIVPANIRSLSPEEAAVWLEAGAEDLDRRIEQRETFMRHLKQLGMEEIIRRHLQNQRRREARAAKRGMA